jgi:hypothetical protein
VCHRICSDCEKFMTVGNQTSAIQPETFCSPDCKHFGILQVCLRDRVIVDITNNMAGRTTSIHWHGVFQKGSQYMDGVPMVTQCTIHEGDTFRYDFIANNEGTHFWHSHDGKYMLLRHVELVTISTVYFKETYRIACTENICPKHFPLRLVSNISLSTFL